ncbi:MAG: type II secretion system GspH family protein [Phycisphaerales bacterium]|nr:type II secretion system GspH family protein [Phycisphaerales bacterium]
MGVRGDSSRPGFTLIELLVVIAIVAVLIAILLPVLGKARAAGRLSVCLSTTRTIGQAMSMYADDNRGVTPREGTMGENWESLRDRIPWNVAFRPYLDERCSPRADLNDQFEDAPYYSCPSHTPEPHHVHYVVNGFAFRAPGVPDERGTDDPHYRRGPTGIWLVPFPFEMLYLTDLAADEDNAMFNVWIQLGNTDISIGQCYDAWLPRHITPWSGDFRIGPFGHGNGAVGMFLDVHAEHRPGAFFMDVASWDDRYYAKE